FYIDNRTFHKGFMAQPVPGVFPAIYTDLVYIAVGITVGRSVYDHLFTVFESYGHLFEQGCPHYIFIRCRANGVESHCRKYIPGRSLAIVLISAIPVRGRPVHPVHGLSYPILGFPWFPGIIIEIYHMLYWLVT